MLDCPLFKQARIVLDDWQCVLQSPDSFAPVGLLQPTAFHLESKGPAAEASQQDLHPHSAQDTQQPSALGLDKPSALSHPPQPVAVFRRSAAAASAGLPAQTTVIEVPAHFPEQVQGVTLGGNMSTSRALSLGHSRDALSSASSAAQLGTGTTPSSKTERVLPPTSSSASQGAAGSAAGSETAEQVLSSAQPTAAGVPQWSSEVQLQQGQHYTRAWCCPTAVPGALLGSRQQTAAALDAALHAIQAGRPHMLCKEMGVLWSVKARLH